MSNKNNVYNPDRNLVDVFKDLQQKRAEDAYLYTHQKEENNSHSTGVTTYISSNKRKRQNYSYAKSLKQQNRAPHVPHSLKTKLSISVILIALIVSFILLFISYSFTTYGKEEIAVVPEAVAFETNQNSLDLNKIISSNVDTQAIKETVNQEREVNFITKYQSSDTLPKGEEVIIQQGSNGKNKVVAVRTYSNNEIVEENIIESTVITPAVEQLVNIGTSEFLAKHKVHLGDIMYVNADVSLKESANSKSKDIIQILATLDVKLLELAGDFCKISYDNNTGYVKSSVLVSSSTAPEMVDKSRIQRILRDIQLDMNINKKSGLSQDDYRRMLSGHSNDTNKILENNYKAFFDVEQKYNINGVFLASLAIHESGWGTSQICLDKKNLFGYGSYDRDPYNSSYVFEDYKDGIDMVAKALVKYYINQEGTIIYDNEKAVATYYNGPTLAGINTRYSTDPDWHKKVFNYMDMLYKKL